MLPLIFLLYGFSRLVNLTLLPIFNDEAIYLDWAWRSLHLPQSAFFSLYDAKPPLLLWLFGLSRAVFTDPLLAGRLVSIGFGLFSAAGLYCLASKLFRRRVGLLAALSYIFIPIFAFFDRQALMESALGAVNIWALYFFLEIVKTQKIKPGICLGLILGLGFLIKYTAGIYFLLVLILGLLAAFNLKQPKTPLLMSLMAAGFISQWLMFPLYLQEKFWASFRSVDRYAYSVVQIFSGQLIHWGASFLNLLIIAFWHLTPLVFISALFGIWQSLKKPSRENLIALLWLAGSLLLLILVSKNITPRYLVPFLLPLVVYLAYFVSSVNFFVRSLVFILPALLTAALIFQPLTYFQLLNRVTQFSQQNEYVSSWTSGYGLAEVIKFIEEQGRSQPIAVAFRLDAGIPESAILAYFQASDKINPFYLDERLLKNNLNDYQCLAFDKPLYFISRDDQLAGLGKFLVEVKRVYKPFGGNFIGIYRLKENCLAEPLVLKSPV